MLTSTRSPPLSQSIWSSQLTEDGDSRSTVELFAKFVPECVCPGERKKLVVTHMQTVLWCWISNWKAACSTAPCPGQRKGQTVTWPDDPEDYPTGWGQSWTHGPSAGSRHLTSHLLEVLAQSFLKCQNMSFMYVTHLSSQRKPAT